MFFIRMIIILLLIQLLPALYLYLRYMRKRQRLKRWSIAFCGYTIIQMLCSVWFVSAGITSGQPEWTWRLFFPIMLGAVGSESILCLCSLIAAIFKKLPSPLLKLSQPFFYLGCIVASVIIFIVTMAYFVGNKRIEVKEYNYSSHDLPQAFDGLKIVHISDLHLGTYGTDTARVAQLINKTMEQQGDIIVFTGDLVNFSSKEAQPFKQILGRLRAPLGVFAILGNHDYATYGRFATKRQQVEDINRLVAIEQECGWTVLRNENALITRDSSHIAIVGVENDGRPPFPQFANIPKAMKGLPHSADTIVNSTEAANTPLFKIFLTHDPSHWRRSVLRETDAQLTLAGHTHGMQFMIHNWSPASWVVKEWGGQYYEGERSLIVSLGLGLGSVPFRFGAWSEVCVITLHKN